MTCIVGIAQDGKVWMGADSFALSNDIVYSTGPKLFRQAGFIVGTSGDRRYSEILAFALKLEAPPADADICRWMATDFARAVRSAAGEFGLIQKDEEGKESTGSSALVAGRGMLFRFDGMLSHVCIREGFASIGSGAHVALGSLHESGFGRLEPGERLARALEAAEVLTYGVRRPFHFDDL